MMICRWRGGDKESNVFNSQQRQLTIRIFFINTIIVLLAIDIPFYFTLYTHFQSSSLLLVAAGW